MKIVSKFKDYYDGGAVYGIDQERIYVRETKLIDDKDITSVGFNVIGFCGKLYPFESKLPYYPEGHYIGDYNPKELTIFGDDILEYKLEEVKDDSIYVREPKYKKVKRKYREETRWLKGNSREKLAEKIKEAENDKNLLDIFLKYKTPIFWFGFGKNDWKGRDGNLLINPSLKMLGFQKVMNTMDAFQQIEMFLSNQLAQDTHVDVPVGSDEIIGMSKGFDRFSFRNAKKKPKKF